MARDEYVPFVEILAVHIHRGQNGEFYATVVEKDERTGRVRHRAAFPRGGYVGFDDSDPTRIDFQENR